ncbi:peptidoglycan hydrolase CwlO-like protein [Lysinibacillus parviboronicapiens]|uniref:Peptidoglycan hydrolase CwlO-like protein n=1 Tax=Lysinibacillus parviboronicapiens TaxID=436516 RepID=A0ABV2PMJ1_9BACI
MTVELGIVLTILSLVVAVQGYQLNKTKSIKDDGKQTAEVSAQLQYISKGVDDIRIDIKANEKQVQVLTERVTRVEESQKSFHKRLDKVEGK